MDAFAVDIFLQINDNIKQTFAGKLLQYFSCFDWLPKNSASGGFRVALT